MTATQPRTPIRDLKPGQLVRIGLGEYVVAEVKDPGPGCPVYLRAVGDTSQVATFFNSIDTFEVIR
jgi:hypothetical protein